MGKAPEFSSTEPENMKTYITSLSIILQFGRRQPVHHLQLGFALDATFRHH